MIVYVKKTDSNAATEENEHNRFESILKLAAERRLKADTDGTRRCAGQTAEDIRLR